MIGQSFWYGARYAFLDSGHKVIVNVSQHNWWLRPLLFQRPRLDQPFLFDFQHLNWLQTSPSPPSWSIIFLHCLSLRPRISYLKCHAQTRVCLQLRAGIYSSVPVAFIAATETSLSREEDYWHGYSAAYEHSQLTCSERYVLLPT